MLPDRWKSPWPREVPHPKKEQQSRKNNEIPTVWAEEHSHSKNVLARKCYLYSGTCRMSLDMQQATVQKSRIPGPAAAGRPPAAGHEVRSRVTLVCRRRPVLCPLGIATSVIGHKHYDAAAIKSQIFSRRICTKTPTHLFPAKKKRRIVFGSVSRTLIIFSITHKKKNCIVPWYLAGTKGSR